MTPKRLLALLVLTCGGFLHADTPKPVLLPPEPKAPHFDSEATDRKSAIEQAIAIQEYRKAMKARRDGLTPEQAAYELVKVYGLSPDPDRLPKAEDGYEWQIAAKASGCSVDALSLLQTHKIAFGKKLTQCFSVYTGNQYPVFITSDSLLNAFHVLFEDTFRELELHRAPLLREYLETLLNKSREWAKESGYSQVDLAPGLRYSQLVVGPALRLLGTPLEYFDSEVRCDIENQVTKAKRSEAVELPKWLGEPTASLLAIDYRRCRPVGFYSSNDRLSDYFRAVRWLQMIPFRSSRDNELSAIALLGSSLYHSSFPRGGTPEEFFQDYEHFLGIPDNPSILTAAKEFQISNRDPKNDKDWAAILKWKREWLLRRDNRYVDDNKVSDELRRESSEAADPPQGVFHVLSAYRLPDAVLFQQLADHGEEPSGLAVATMLGSLWGKEHFSIKDSAFVEKALKPVLYPKAKDEYGYYPSDPSIYGQYLAVLATLFEPPDPAAPAFIKSEAWAAKSCQTALAGWAQMRHTFTLQAKLTLYTSGASRLPPGFIEPNPSFFDHFAGLVQNTKTQLNRCHTFVDTPATKAEFLRDKATYVEKIGGGLKGADDAGQINSEDEDFFSRELETLIPDGFGWTEKFYTLRRDQSTSQPDFISYLHKLASELRDEANRYERGERQVKLVDSKVEERWETLETLGHKLAYLAQKQLRSLPLDDEATEIIKGYGYKLAHIMGYDGTPCLRDDAPRWVEVLSDPRKNESLASCIGRPKLIYVLYPWNGTEVFCQGSVMSYYEYHSKDRLTDAEWKQLLDSPQAPAQPDWLQPYLAK